MIKSSGTKYFCETLSDIEKSKKDHNNYTASYYSPTKNYKTDGKLGTMKLVDQYKPNLPTNSKSFSKQVSTYSLKEQKDERLETKKYDSYYDKAATTKVYHNDYKEVAETQIFGRRDMETKTINYSDKKEASVKDNNTHIVTKHLNKDIPTKLSFDIDRDIPTKTYKNNYSEVSSTVEFGRNYNADLPTKQFNEDYDIKTKKNSYYVQEQIPTVKKAKSSYYGKSEDADCATKTMSFKKQNSYIERPSFGYRKEEGKKAESVYMGGKYDDDEIKTKEFNYKANNQDSVQHTIDMYKRQNDNMETKKMEGKYERVTATRHFGMSKY